MTRPTSWESYKRLEESGNLSKRRMEVLRFVFAYPGCTALDCTEYYDTLNKTPADGVRQRSWHQRFADLVHMGLIFETGVREYKGRRRITYDVTGLTEPKPIVRQIAKKERVTGIMKTALDTIARTEAGCYHCSELSNIARVALVSAGY